jgi:hypothetical protein
VPLGVGKSFGGGTRANTQSQPGGGHCHWRDSVQGLSDAHRLEEDHTGFQYLGGGRADLRKVDEDLIDVRD